MKGITLLLFLLFDFVVVNGQTITTFGGNGTNGDSGDGGPATSAALTNVCYGVWDKYGNYFFAVRGKHKVRKIASDGTITTVAGTGTSGYSGNGYAATNATLNNPLGVAVDGSGNLFIADLNNNVIRRVDRVTGNISTVAGNGSAGYSGDGSMATNAALNGPTDLCIDPSGNLYFSDRVNKIIRKISSSGIITRFAGIYNDGGYEGDGGPATLAKIYAPDGVCSDKYGNIFICNGDKVRKVEATTNIISTVAGNGVAGFSGENGVATSAMLYRPMDVVVNNKGEIFIADVYNHRIRMVNSSKIISTIAGKGTAAYSGDGSIANLSELNMPEGVALDTCDNLYIGDMMNFRIRKVSFNPECFPVNVYDMHEVKVNVSIYPNPATNEVVIKAEEINSVSIANALGQVVIAEQYKGKEKVTLDIRHLSAGVYFVRVNEVWVQRFMKE